MAGAVRPFRRSGWLSAVARRSSSVAVCGLLAALVLSRFHSKRAGLASEPQCDTNESLVLDASAFGVRRYSIPGELGNGTECALPGTLHVYLKALRWPMRDGSLHLLLKGFVAFEATSYPDTWPKSLYHNPAMISTLRLFLASQTSQNWTRELSLHWSNQTVEAGQPAAEACRVLLTRPPRRIKTLLDIRVDLGPLPDPALDLIVDGWPRRASLKAQLQQALASQPAQTASSGPPLLVRALPYFFGMPLDHAALLLDWSNQYYEPLGFDGAIAYVVPDDAAELSAQPRIRALVAAHKLTLFLWDGFAEYPGWQHYSKQMNSAHATLSMWGRNALVLVLDIDEWLVPGQPRATLRQLMAPGGCLAALGSPDCIIFPKRDIFPYQEPPADGSAPDEPGWWRNASGSHPLRYYRFVSERRWNPKIMSRPESVTTLGVHDASLCIGKDAVADSSPSGSKLESACGTQTPCAVAPASCTVLLHVRNTFQARLVSANTSQIQPAEWLWMLDEHRRH